MCNLMSAGHALNLKRNRKKTSKRKGAKEKIAFRICVEVLFSQKRTPTVVNSNATRRRNTTTEVVTASFEERIVCSVVRRPSWRPADYFRWMGKGFHQVEPINIFGRKCAFPEKSTVKSATNSADFLKLPVDTV